MSSSFKESEGHSMEFRVGRTGAPLIQVQLNILSQSQLRQFYKFTTKCMHTDCMLFVFIPRFLF